jgi:hypothetical protein
MLLTNDNIFNENVEMDYILSDPEDYMADEEDAGYFSDDDVPAHETDEVTDEFFFAHLLDGPISIHQSGNKKTSSSSVPVPTTTDAAAVARDKTSTSVPELPTSSSVPTTTTTDDNANADVDYKLRIQDAAYEESNRYWFGEDWKEIDKFKKMMTGSGRAQIPTRT